MSGKRGQVTIFIIVAIVVVVGVVSLFLFRDKIFASSSEVPSELVPMVNQVQNCVETTLRDGTKLVGLQGGYVIPPKNSLETNFSNIAYGYYLGQDVLASQTKINEEIIRYIYLTLPLCFDASSFSNYKIIRGKLSASVKTGSDMVSVDVNYPLSISKDQSSWRIDKKYSAKYGVRFGSMYNVAKNIVEKERQDSGSIDFSYLNGFGYDISILNDGNRVIVYSISDNKVNETGGYVFRFANEIK